MTPWTRTLLAWARRHRDVLAQLDRDDVRALLAALEVV